MVTTLYLVRHGESLGNTNGFFQGRTDCDLTENGVIQAQALKEYFKDIDFDEIYSSPLRRTRETANAINHFKKLPIHVDSSIIEIDGGEFEGLSWKEIPESFSVEFDVWRNNPAEFHAPKGESMKQVYERMKNAILGIVMKNISKTIVIVSHGCSIKNFLCYASSVEFEKIDTIPWCDNASVSKVCFDEKLLPRVVFSNYSNHLDSLGLKKPKYWDDSIKQK